MKKLEIISGTIRAIEQFSPYFCPYELSFYLKNKNSFKVRTKLKFNEKNKVESIKFYLVTSETDQNLEDKIYKIFFDSGKKLKQTAFFNKIIKFTKKLGEKILLEEKKAKYIFKKSGHNLKDTFSTRGINTMLKY